MPARSFILDLFVDGTQFRLDLIGFDSDQLDEFLSRADPNQWLTDEDAIPEVPETAVSAPGDVWLLEHHRVLCGDATVMASFERVLAGGMADLVFTDPPYNVHYAQSAGKYRGGIRRIANDHLGLEFEQFLHAACRNMLEVTRGALYICMSSSELATLQKTFREAGGHWSTFVIWAKNQFTLGRSDYQRQYEPILYGWKEGTTHFWCGARDQGDVWFVDRPQVNDPHLTMKPVELVERAIGNSSKMRGTVLDPFGGSGTTVIACEKTGRQAWVIELDACYVDVTVRRWEEFTGKQATLEGDERSFAALKAARGQMPAGILTSLLPTPPTVP